MSMNNFKLVVIGGNRYMEKGPFINFIDLSLKKNIETIVYTDNFHWSMPTSNKSYFSEDIQNVM